GTLKWTLAFEACSSPAIGTDDTIYITSNDFINSKGKLCAINPSSTLKWTYQTSNELYSHPSIGADGTIYAMSQNKSLYAINPDGTLKWNNSYSNNFWSYLAIGGDGTIYVGSDYGTKLYAINPNNGTLKWTFATPDYDFVHSPVISADGTIYCGCDGTKIYAINPNGTLKWSYIVGDTVSSLPVIEQDGTLYVGTYDYFYAFGESEATPTLTETATSTLTSTMTLTPTLTTTMTATMTAFMTQTSTGTTGPTFTATKTPTSTGTPFVDYLPFLDTGSVSPSSGYPNNSFTYTVNYTDPDGGIPWIMRLYINGKGRDMTKKTESGNGTYTYLISGSELNTGENNFRFYFRDDEGNMVHLPELGIFKGPTIYSYKTMTPTKTQSPTLTYSQTLTQTPQKTKTLTPTLLPTPTITPEIQNCLCITSPSDFYYNSIILSWTPIIGVDHYVLDIMIQGNTYTFNYIDNYLKIIAQNLNDWQTFVNIGTLSFRITAYDATSNIIDGPTDWSDFACYSEMVGANISSPEERRQTWKSAPTNAEPGCLRISSPSSFDYNTILLSWTPIQGTDHYLIKYRYSNWFFEGEVKDNWLRLIVPEQNIWNQVKDLGKIYYNIKALDSDGKVIDGPTGWSSFTCK
ncbi:PQQ-binding-like beta-propeller repeat protein, partial [bacterium]|nr:PQQ-binding-like beta-propeller repeat protein [bacterium]